MTAISPLQSIHKIGLFGDHHKKNEGDLLNIAELKNLSIIQLVQYKSSKIKTNNIDIDSIKIPLNNLEASSGKNTRILWSSPNTWLIISKKENVIKEVNEKCNNSNFAITDISHSRTVIQIQGHQAKEVLKKGCPLNFNDFARDTCAGSVFHGIAILIDCTDSDPQTFNILTLRSFGESLYHHITDSALEFGYIGI